LTLAAVPDSHAYDATTQSRAAVTVTGLQVGDNVTASQRFDSPAVGARVLSVAPGYLVNDGNGGANYLINLESTSGSITALASTKPVNLNPVQELIWNATQAGLPSDSNTTLAARSVIQSVDQSVDQLADLLVLEGDGIRLPVGLPINSNLDSSVTNVTGENRP
ncbi:MAG: hypothetical protein ABI351_06925, partial [Herbaspirillum sp.]